jgi:malate dehydrogenase
MQHVAIIGAGELGGAVAHVLARRDLVRSITLIDDSGRVASGKALDIAQAAPVEGFATQLSGSSDVSVAAGAAIVILAERADRSAGGEWQGEAGVCC